MSDKYVDPSGNTEAFRAFAHDPQTAPAGGSSKKTTMIIAGVVAVLLLLLTVWIFLG